MERRSRNMLIIIITNHYQYPKSECDYLTTEEEERGRESESERERERERERFLHGDVITAQAT